MVSLIVRNVFRIDVKSSFVEGLERQMIHAPIEVITSAASGLRHSDTQVSRVEGLGRSSRQIGIEAL